MPNSSLWLATSGKSISPDHMRNSTGIHCLINISGTRGGAYGNTYVFSSAQSLQEPKAPMWCQLTKGPYVVPTNYPWTPNWLGCSDTSTWSWLRVSTNAVSYVSCNKQNRMQSIAHEPQESH